MIKVRDQFRLWLERIDWKMAIRSGIAGMVAFTLGTYITHYLDRPDRLASGLWTTLTAIIVLQAYLGSTYKASWNRFLGVLIGSVMGALFTEYLGPGPWQLGLCVFATVIVCALIALPESYRVASVSAAVVMVLWSFNQELSPWIFGFYRFMDTCIGIALAVIVAHTIFPEKAVDKLRKDVADTIRKLNQLYRMVFIIEPNDVPFQTLSDEISVQLKIGKRCKSSNRKWLNKSTPGRSFLTMWIISTNPSNRWRLSIIKRPAKCSILSYPINSWK
jgi:uncharacterized membrane protein YccC